MAKHKAAHQITIASTSEETAFHQFVDRYWKLATVIAIVIAGGILWRTFSKQKERESADASWDRLRQEVSFASGFAVTSPDPATLDSLAIELENDDAGPWAKALQVAKLLEENKNDEAMSALAELEQTFGDHPILSQTFQFEEDGPRKTLAAHWRGRTADIDAWEGSHRFLFENPALPGDAPRVRLNTSKGSILVGLYKNRAPKHVENFLKLCGEGYYDGTRFHRVIADFMIQGGDPNSRDGAPETWGLGGPEYKIDPELTELRHFTHVLAAAKQGSEKESNGSQFYITTTASHQLDGVHTVYGAVIEGIPTIEAIASGAVIGDRPQDPVVIESTEVLP